jgi:L-arabinose isomerase
MSRIYFITGSQDLYGEETLNQVAADSKDIAGYLNSRLSDTVEIVWQPTVRNSEEIIDVCQKASVDKSCIGVITWMHTFSPAKMWIKGLQVLNKPLLHLHTQYNEKLPYATIDMDFMNLNQSAHGDREFGFILSRLGIKHEVVAGYYKHENTINEIRKFAQVAKAIAFSRSLKAAMFGSNMRDVSVTDGDRVESQIRYGWEVNYYGIGELAALADEASEAEITKKLDEYKLLYNMSEKDIDSIKVQARYEIALDKFLDANGISAFTDTFQDLYGLRQLPGLAVQREMARGIGFGAEGDYKTACLTTVLHKMAEGREGATGFMEDYTYDLTEGHELVLAAHMLEVSPEFASTKPQIEVHPLGIGGKEPPARLVFEGVVGDGVAVCMTDMGDRFRLICAEIELVRQPQPMPNLPVARLMWKLKPDFKNGAKAWLEAGGGHHTVVSTALTSSDIEMFAKLTNTECIVIR